jgi:hypothetical protein
VPSAQITDCIARAEVLGMFGASPFNALLYSRRELSPRSCTAGSPTYHQGGAALTGCRENQPRAGAGGSSTGISTERDQLNTTDERYEEASYL